MPDLHEVWELLRHPFFSSLKVPEPVGRHQVELRSVIQIYGHDRQLIKCSLVLPIWKCCFAGGLPLFGKLLVDHCACLVVLALVADKI